MKKIVIKCPCCETEYLPGEIYLPTYFLGQPKNIVKGFDGSILDYEDDSMDLEEEYTCDKCNTKFKVKASVSFKTEKIVDPFDEEEYVSKGE